MVPPPAAPRRTDSLGATLQTLGATAHEAAAAAGTGYFQLLVEHLAQTLDARYAFIAECTDADRTRVRMLAFWRDGDLGENLTYSLRGTPCEHVIEGNDFHTTGVVALFPTDRWLVALRADGYLGVPLRDAAGEVLGHVAVLDDKPLRVSGEQLALVKVLAARAGAELERARAIAHVERLNRELGVLVDINRAVGRRLDRDALFGALAGCLKRLLPTDRFGIELPIEDGAKLQGHLLSQPTHPEGPTHPTILPAPGTACDWVIRNRVSYVVAAREELRERFPVTHEVMTAGDLESLCALPLVSGERTRGALFFMASAPGAYGGVSWGLLDQVATAVGVALDDCLAHEEVRALRDRLAEERVYLQEEIKTEHNFEEVVGASPALTRVLQAVERVAGTEATVLLLGETGTGKELIARAIHGRSRRSDGVMVKVNCATIPAGLIESELFGHEKGAFTGAVARSIGRFELADGSTILLDEVGELPLDLQAKLLRVLQEGEFERLGGTRTLRTDVRVLAATNRDLAREVAEGRFRSDLYYRLNVFPITVPPLRDRVEDIPLLARHFLRKHGAALGKPIEAISRAALERLTAYSWPGNVRELEHVIQRAVILSAGPALQVPELAAGPAAPAADDAGATLEEVERRHILGALERAGWRVSGPRGAARALGLKPTTLEARMKKLGIRRPPQFRGRGASDPVSVEA